MKQTPLYEKHLALGARLIDFGGWELPVQYTGILEEHQQVRAAAGLFDVSHMGEITVKGDGATDFLDRLLTNRVSGIAEGRVVYSPMCYPDGGCVDDLLAYRMGPEDWLLVVNAGNTDKDFEWIRSNGPAGVHIRNVSADYAQLAVQGPASVDILAPLTEEDLSTLGFFRFRPRVLLAGIPVILSRTGYTGEDGFELYAAAGDGPALWDALMDAGRDKGLVPVGLGARDTLRFEAALPLYGHELSTEISPVEAGLSRFIAWDKPDFLGKDALAAQRAAGPARKLAGFEMIDRGIPRNGYPILAEGKAAGFVTSGSVSPTLDKNLGMGVMPSAFASPGTELEILIREKPLKARVVPLPFYQKKYHTEVGKK